METPSKKIRSIIRGLIEDVLREEDLLSDEDTKNSVSEINATSNIDGGAGPPRTPFAFDDDDEEGHAENIKSKSEVFDFKTTKNNKENTVKLNEGKSLYHIFRDHNDYTPKQKVGVAIREVNKLLNDVDKIIGVSSQFKIETNIDSKTYWKTTVKHLLKIEDKLSRLSRKIKEMR